MEKRFRLRWKNSCCILFGFEWMNRDDYSRRLWHRLHVTIFGFDFWLEGKKKFIDPRWSPEVLEELKKKERKPVKFNLIKDLLPV
jgi:hypothetical protein